MSSSRRTPSRVDHGAAQSKAVTVTYGALSSGLLVLIATVALIVKPPSPPALAEFAPQAQETIDEGPQDQSSRFGTGGSGECAAGQGGCGAEGVLPEDALTPNTDSTPAGRQPAIEVPRIKNCAGGEPPRQIEDPQSPPCADYWEGPDNGGATSRGVTRDEIRVAWHATYFYQDVPDRSFRTITELARFFDRRFEFYGRKLKLVLPPAASSEGQEYADWAHEAQVFASISDRFADRAWRRRAAGHGVISITPDDYHTTEAELASMHPYAWTYSLTFDKLSDHLAEVVCNSLIGRKAGHAGVALRDRTRKFALVVERSDIMEYVDSSVLRTALERCTPVTYHESGPNKEDAASTVASLKSDDHTTIIVLETAAKGGGALEYYMMEAAAAQGYEPEWLRLGGGGREDRRESSNRIKPQVDRVFGLFATNKLQPVANRPSTWAYREEGIDTIAEVSPETDEFERNYRSLLLLASGIQAAGPNLTPDSFARGLQRLKFPNPGAGAAPYYQASVGFTGDHSMVDDEAIAWWSSAAKPHYDRAPSGGWCYLEAGKRWRRGRFPKGDIPFFDPTVPCQ